MTRIRTIGDLAESLSEGRTAFCSFRKSISGSILGAWLDFSTVPGSPPAQYYGSTPLEAAVLNGNRGIWTGGDVSPAQKQIAKFGVLSPSASLSGPSISGPVILLDYVLYYPFIDLDTGDEQPFVNNVTLPRYTDGEGLKAMLVTSGTTSTAGSFQFDYINQDGDEKTSPVISTPGSTSLGYLVTGTINGPFLDLADADTGIRSVVSFTNLTPTGGLGTLVLVRPIHNYLVYAVGGSSEVVHGMTHQVSEPILDGAYLNLLGLSGSAGALPLAAAGYVRSVWK